MGSVEDSIGGECEGSASVMAEYDPDTGRVNEILRSNDRRFLDKFVECIMGSKSKSGSTLVLNSTGEISNNRI